MNNEGFRNVLNFDVQPPKNGACLGYPTDWWFPEKSMTSQQYRDMAQAKEICNTCAVRQECLDYAIEAGEYYGVWGGMSATAREKEVERRKKLGLYKEPTRLRVVL